MTRPRPDALRHCIAAGFSLVFLSEGCATVDPKPDYGRAGYVVRERTLASESYNPADEGAVEEKVDALLEGGVTLEEAVQIALLNNAALQALFQNIGVSRADLVQSGLLSNPVFSIAAQLPEGGGRAKLTGGLAQDIADLWQIPVRKKVAQADLDRTILEVARAATTLALDVEAQVYRVLAAQRVVELSEQTSRVRQRRVETERSRLRAGESELAAFNQAQLQLIEAKFEISTAKRDLEASRLVLARMLGLSRRKESISIQADFPPVATSEPEMSTLLDRAASERLDVQAAEAALNGAQAECERQLRRRFPSVIVGIEGERGARRAMPGRNLLADTARTSVARGRLSAPSIESRSQRALARRQEIDTVLGPSISMPLPIFDQNQAQIAKARFVVEQRYKEYVDLLNTVAFDVHTAMVTLQTAREQLALFHDEMMPLVEQGTHIAQTIYGVGEQGIVVVLDAEQTMLTLRRSYANAQRDYAIAITDLSRALGTRAYVESPTPAPADADVKPKEPS